MSDTIHLYGRTLDRNGPSLSVQLYDILRHEILRGRWDIGERMPSYQDLVDQTGLNQWHIQRALARLDDDGYVERIRHKGIFVKATKTRSNETLGKILLVCPEEDMIRDRFGDHRSSFETQGFGLIDAYSVAHYAGRLGLQVEFCTAEPSATHIPRLTAPKEGEPMFGIISLLPAERLASLRPPGCDVPTVYLGTDDRFALPSITGNPLMAAYGVTTRLLKLGHREIAVMSDPRLHIGTERAIFDGITRAMQLIGIDVDPEQLPVLRHPGAPVPAGVTAIFSFTIELAQQCFEALEARGVRIPDDLSLACLQTGRTHGDHGTPIYGAGYPWEHIISSCFDMLLAPEQYREQGLCQLTFEPTVTTDDASIAPLTPPPEVHHA